MNPWRIRRALDLGAPVYAHRKIKLAGRAFAIGEAIDWRALGVTERKLRDLFRQRTIGHSSTRSRQDAVAPMTLPPTAKAGAVIECEPVIVLSADIDTTSPVTPSPITVHDHRPLAGERLPAPDLAAFRVTPGERVTIETPSQARDGGDAPPAAPAPTPTPATPYRPGKRR